MAHILVLQTLPQSSQRTVSIEFLVLSLLTLHLSTFKEKEKTQLRTSLHFSTNPETMHLLQTLTVSFHWHDLSERAYECDTCQLFLHHWRDVKVFILAQVQQGSGRYQHDYSFLFHLEENVLSRAVKNNGLVGTTKNSVRAGDY